MALALDDLRQRRPHRAPDAEQVDLEDPLPLLGRRSPRVGRHLRLGDAGVGDGDVEAAEALDRLGDRGHHRAVVGDVGGDPDRPLADPLGRLARLARRRGRATATEAPRMCIWRAVSKPIPRAAPVTSATFPLRS